MEMANGISGAQMVRIRKEIDESEQYRFNIDVNADDSFETVSSLDPVVNFAVPGGTASIPIRGFMVNQRGERVPFDLGDVVLPNHAPRFVGPRLIRQDGFDVVIAASAIDIDGDPITTTVDWEMEPSARAGMSSIAIAMQTHDFRHTRFG